MLDLNTATFFPVLNKQPLVAFSELEAGDKVIYDDADVALLTGEKSGVVVVDIDDMDVDLPWATETFCRKTKNGGLHLYYQHPGFTVPTLTKFPVEGVDLRGDTNGYVVYQGDGYEDLNDLPIAPCPQYLCDRIAEYELRKRERKPSDFVPVDLATPFGAKMLRAGEDAAKTLDVGGPGTRDGRLFSAALSLVRGRGLDPEVAAGLLLEHYAPRVSADGADTVSERRVRYKCDEAASVGTYERLAITKEDVASWVEKSKPFVASKREEFDHYTLPEPPEPAPAKDKRIPRPDVDLGYRPMKARDMVPADKLDKVNFGMLTYILATHESWFGRLAYDRFSDQYKVYEPPVEMEDKGFFSQNDVTAVRLWLACCLSIDATADAVEKALCYAAMGNAFHPVMEYLEALDPVDDPESVLEDLCVTGLGITNPIVVNYTKKFFVGAVRRILNPGCKMDGVLVLHGEQNTGKSSFLYALSPDHAWVQENVPDLENKDAFIALQGRWLVEIAELQALIRKSETAVKAFLTRQDDVYRKPFDRGASRCPRQCVFIATTNDTEFLRDPTGSRRYWIVETPGVNLPWVESNRDRIWSAALTLAKTNYQHQLTRKEIDEMAIIQKDFEAKDSWHNQIEKFLEGKTKITSVDEVYIGALHGGLPADADAMRAKAILGFDRQAQLRVADTLRRLGWQRRTGKNRGWTKEDA